jgi:hypothetical protein
MNKMESKSFISYLKNFNLLKSFNPKFLKLLVLIGLVSFTKDIVLFFIYEYYKHFIRPRKNHIKRYGGKWALITGASDGIGEGLCYKFAEVGFNIVIVGRH